MRNKFILSLVVISLSGLSYSCSNINLTDTKTTQVINNNKIELSDMVKVDKDYVASLVLTSQGNIDKSKKAISILKDSWSSFKNKNYSNLDKINKDLFDKIEKTISDAEKSISDSKISEAHEELEPFRQYFYEFRKNIKVDYYMDYLTDFHSQMENVLNAGISEGDNEIKFNKIKEVTPKAIDTFKNLENKSFDKVLFNFSDEKDTQRKNFIESEKLKLDELKKAIDSNDKDLSIKKSQEIKENFVKLFSLFGDINSIK